MTSTEQRLARVRGAVAPCRHNARTIAALTSNPGCARRAVLDSAGVDKQRLASYVGFPERFGQSQFAITRGNAFEAQVKANGCASGWGCRSPRCPTTTWRRRPATRARRPGTRGRDNS